MSCCALLLCDFICVNICWPHVIGHIQLHETTNSRTLLQENTFENKPKKENNNKKKSWQEVKSKQSQTQEVVNQSCSKASEYPSGVWYGCVCTCVDTSVSWKQNLPILMCIHSKKQRNQRKRVSILGGNSLASVTQKAQNTTCFFSFLFYDLWHLVRWERKTCTGWFQWITNLPCH